MCHEKAHKLNIRSGQRVTSKWMKERERTALKNNRAANTGKPDHPLTPGMAQI